MDIVFLPFYAAGLLVAIIGALIGMYRFRKTSKFVGALIGILGAIVIMGMLKTILPFKLTTNTKAYNAQQQTEIHSRHAKLPPKVEVEEKSFDEKLNEADIQNQARNQQLQKDLQL